MSRAGLFGSQGTHAGCDDMVFCSLAGSSGKALYPHQLIDHLPEDIRLHGVDVLAFSAEGWEHGNKNVLSITQRADAAWAITPGNMAFFVRVRAHMYFAFLGDVFVFPRSN